MPNLHYLTHQFLLYSANTLAVYFILCNLSSLILIVLAWRSVKGLKSPSADDSATPEWESVSILVPAHNEERTIVESVRALLKIEYSNFDIIVIDDGSQDGTVARLTEKFHLVPSTFPRYSHLSPVSPTFTYQSETDSRLKLLQRENGGKASALNLGIDYASNFLVCTIDSDTVVEPSALRHAVRPFRAHPRTLLGAGCTLRICNGATYSANQRMLGHLPPLGISLFQILEYIRAFFLGRMGWDALDATTLLSGAFALFRKSALIDVSGFDPTSITEDLEIVLRLRRKYLPSHEGPRFKIVPQPLAWTQAPTTLGDLKRQRIRWQRGLIESMRKHWPLVFAPKQKWVGMGAIPYLMAFEVLGPVVELMGYLIIPVGIFHGAIHLAMVMYLILAGVLYSIAIGIVTIHLEERHFSRHPSLKRDWRLFLTATVLDCLVFRQVIWLFRLQALAECLYKRPSWSEQKRVFFGHDDEQRNDKRAA